MRSCGELGSKTQSNSISNVRTKQQHLNIMGNLLRQTTKCKKLHFSLSISPARLDYVQFCLYLKLPGGRTVYVCTYVCPYRGNLKWSGLTLARYFGEPGSTLYGAFDLCCVCAGWPAVRPPLLPDDQPLRHHPLHLYLSFVNRRRQNLVASLEIPNPIWHYGCNWHQTNTMLHCNTLLVSIFMASRMF